jgi:Mrp family chromosome partitioning ATPase
VSDTPRYATLRDYLQVLRSNGWLIILVTVVFAASAYAISSQQADEYAAETSVSFQDPTREFELFGSTPGEPGLTPDQRAAIKAGTATSPRIMARVKKELRTPLSADQLEELVSARPEARTNLVVIEARSGNPKFAAALVTELARQVRLVEEKRTRVRFDKAARSLQRRVRQARRRSPDQNEFVRASAEDRISRLQALRDFARPVEIVKRAEVPTSTVAPRPQRNTIFGALIGLAVGMLAAFARDALDIRFRGSRQIQSELGLPILAQITSQAMKRRKTAERAEAFQILRANLDFLDPEKAIRTVAVTSAVAEEGKSTVALSLARASAAVGRATLLLECDMRRPSLAKTLGISREPGLADYLAGRAAMPDVLQLVPVAEGPSNGRSPSNGPPAHEPASFTCVTAGAVTAVPAEVLGSGAFHDLLGVLGRSYELVVIDTGPLLPVVDTLEVIPVVDAVLLCVRASVTTRDQAKAARAALDRFPDRPMGLVITDSGREEPDYGYYAPAPKERVAG